MCSSRAAGAVRRFIGHLFDASARAIDGAGGAMHRVCRKRFSRRLPSDGAYRQGGRPGLGRRDPRGARNHERVPARRARNAASRWNCSRRAKRRDFPLEATLRELRRLCGDRTGSAAACSCRSSCRRRYGAEVSMRPGAGAGARLRVRSASPPMKSCRWKRCCECSSLHASRERAGAVGSMVAEAYEVLGVTRDASDSEVTKAYRRLMNQNHPDKLRRARLARVDDEAGRREDPPDPRRL